MRRGRPGRRTRAARPGRLSGDVLSTTAPSASRRSARAARRRDVGALVADARGGDARAVARLITVVEDGGPQLREVSAALVGSTGRAQVVGLTGSPGVGKSTSTTALVTALRARDLRVGVLAVDPSSPFTGGALLGDRVRMQEHATDAGVFIRSMATRGRLGGLSAATPQAVRVLDGVGVDVVLVETVGVGQAEVEVASLADTTLVLLAPGLGDGVQAVKAGVLEIADVFVVNKADRDGAHQTVRDLRGMVAMAEPDTSSDAWSRPVLQTVASRGEGVDGVVDALDAHRAWLERTGGLRRRREARAAAEVEAVALEELRRRVGDLRGGDALAAHAADVVDGRTDVYDAADALVAGLRST